MTTTPTLDFGKHKGAPLAQIPSKYLLWVLREVTDLSDELRIRIEAELESRGNFRHRTHHARYQQHGREERQAERPNCRHADMLTQVQLQVETRVSLALRQWHHELVLRFHPDRGGDPAIMAAINDAVDRLKDHLERAVQVRT